MKKTFSLIVLTFNSFLFCAEQQRRSLSSELDASARHQQLPLDQPGRLVSRRNALTPGLAELIRSSIPIGDLAEDADGLNEVKEQETPDQSLRRIRITPVNSRPTSRNRSESNRSSSNANTPTIRPIDPAPLVRPNVDRSRELLLLMTRRLPSANSSRPHAQDDEKKDQ